MTLVLAFLLRWTFPFVTHVAVLQDLPVFHDGPNVTPLTSYYDGLKTKQNHDTQQNVSFHDGLNMTHLTPYCDGHQASTHFYNGLNVASWSVPVEISIGSVPLQLNVINPSASQWVKPDKSICVTNSYHGPNVIIIIKLSKFIHPVENSIGSVPVINLAGQICPAEVQYQSSTLLDTTPLPGFSTFFHPRGREFPHRVSVPVLILTGQVGPAGVQYQFSSSVDS